jgi:putative mRNA 3-end processing factor
VPCDTFISECTFGLPIFRWRPEAEVMAEILSWWAANAAQGKISVIGAYAFGKAQRLLAGLAQAGPIGPILTHGAVEATTDILRAAGLALPPTLRAGPDTTARTHPGALVIAPPAVLGSPWIDRFGATETAFVSGWMAVRGIRRRRGTARGFVLSDHADWPGLNAAIRETGAGRVFVTHGYTAPFRHWLAEQGYDSGIVATEFGAEDPDDTTPAGPAP